VHYQLDAFNRAEVPDDEIEHVHQHLVDGTAPLGPAVLPQRRRAAAPDAYNRNGELANDGAASAIAGARQKVAHGLECGDETVDVANDPNAL
jgi:hypothetical protein